MTDSAYSADFFRAFEAGSSGSAAQIVPIVVDLVRPRSAVDVGCGIGTWAKALGDAGVSEVVGIDGPYVPRDELLIAPDTFVAADLNRPLPLGREFDLALCLEVGEHLPPPIASRLVEHLTELAPAVLFSAAIPFQGGNHHVNERWPSYWASLFAARGYAAYDVVRPRVWSSAEVEPWYAQNTLLYLRAGHELAQRLTPADPGSSLFDVVHPALYTAQHEQRSTVGQEGRRRLPRPLSALGRRR